MIRTEANIVRLHTAADGSLWQAAGDAAPAEVHTSGFVSSLMEEPRLHVRMLGTADNADTLVELHSRCRGNQRIEVASPLTCEDADELADPEISLYRMRQQNLAPSLGGWHRFTDADYPSYALASALRKDDKLTPTSKALVLTHPVYVDLSFIPTLNIEAAAQVIAALLDPRWYVDVRHPDRFSKLRAYLGLSPKYAAKVAASDLRLQKSRNYANVLATWRGDDTADLTDPANFLLRKLACCDSKFSELRTSQVFVTFLVRTWLNRLYAGSKQTLELFLPDRLFDEEEAAAYKRHITAV